MSVKSLFFYQFSVASFLYHAPLIQNKNAIGVFNGWNTVADNDGGLVFGQALDVL